MINPDIYIRPVTVLDAQFVLEWENDPEWNNREEGGAYSIIDILQFIHELADVHKAKQARWVICSQKDDRPIGAVDLTEIDFIKQEASVGVLIHNKKDRRKGIALYSLQLLEVEAAKLGIRRLLSTVYESNEGSVNLFTKCDFEKIGNTDVQNFKDGTYIKAIIFEKCVN